MIFAVERSNGRWPEHFALELSRDGLPPLEVLTAARMLEIGKPLPQAVPKR